MRWTDPNIKLVAAHTNDRTLVLKVTNRHRDKPLDTVFETDNGQFVRDFQVLEIKTQQKAAVAARGHSLKYTFPAHSFTMLKGRWV
ncbi:MAG: hypothetical protein JO097_08680 [Acidobacteriaceae bacterium]|nr:hypothetical protein [Acidobacteriaceae bacterium]MBV9295250.1 hypothetical protein [Acidobacteriaceae bacterium]MBV9766482.1 hypothetical protein [Acidobacteriaceae bacterium]